MKNPYRWSPTEIERLRELYGHHLLKDIAVMIGRPSQSVIRKAKQLGLSPDRPRWERWQREKFFREYGPKNSKQLAAELGKTVGAVRQFASRNHCN